MLHASEEDSQGLGTLVPSFIIHGDQRHNEQDGRGQQRGQIIAGDETLAVLLTDI